MVKIGGETCEGKTVERLAKGTEALIHLTYEQFVRSIMIPQGEFSKFLHSDAREKAAILARVSGTGHYKQIGAEVWASANKFLEDYDNLKKQRDAIVVLSEEELACLQEEKSAAEAAAEKEQGYAGKLQELIALKKQWDAAEEELIKADGELQRANEAVSAFSEERNVLERAQKALNCQSSYVALDSSRKNLEAEKQQKKDAETELEKLQKSYEEALAEVDKCGRAVSVLEGEEPAKQDLWKKVGALDVRLNPEKEACGEKEEASRKAQEEYETKRKRADELDREIAELQDRIGEYNRYRDENAKDGKLSELCAGLEGNVKELEKADADCERAKADREKFEKQCREETLRFETFSRERDRCSEELLSIVEQKHVVIAGILRSKLEEGKACPVCGSVYHESCILRNDVLDDGEDREAEQEETARVAADVAELSSRLEEAGRNASDAEKKAGNWKIQATNAESGIGQAQSRRKDTLDTVNDVIRPWNEQIDPDDSDAVKRLKEVIERLKERAREYESQGASLTADQTKLAGKKAERAGIDPEKLKEEAALAKGAFEKASEQYSANLDDPVHHPRCRRQCI